MGVLKRVKRLLAQSDGVAVVENTGPATATDGGSATTGYSGPPPKHGQTVVVKNTGPATASGPGSRAVSGIDYT
ncbi:hypothetical protein SEA_FRANKENWEENIE_97 [Streptomyces phage Frankenweenie]|nr:hypothetical protein SEA_FRANKENWEENIE_97 [Streptomyces phage Frankenweenie]